MSHQKFRTETNCLNCGAEVTRKFCPECGQPNLETKENFFHLAGHFLADYFHFDSKFIRSVVPLFTKPGFLTKQYWEGKRVRYIHPLRLYFFITIIFMLATTYFYHHFGQELKGTVIQSNTKITYDSTDVDTTKLDPAQQKIKAEEAAKASKAYAENAMKKLGGGIDRFFHDLKYISFFLLPLYALIFKFLYFRKKRFYVDHLVYTLHLQSFAYILISMAVLLPFVFPETLHYIRRGILLVLLVYIGWSLRYLYHQPWWKTILKSIIATFLLALMTGFALGAYMFVHVMMN
jgi:hypothetical protein